MSKPNAIKDFFKGFSDVANPPKPPLDALKRINCSECGQQFGIQPNLAALRLSDGGYVWCPNGHRLGDLGGKK